MSDWRDFSPLELIRAGRWRRAAFFTYALSLSFFEGILLPHLRRGGLREAHIFADLQGVADALSETGAREVGRAYAVHPVRAPDGVFHAKLGLLDGEDVHLLVGSGNLTFGGWGRNTEVVEHLVPSAHAAAFADVAEFLETLATEPSFTLPDGDAFEVWISRLQAASKGARSGDVRVLHNLEEGIADQLVSYAKDLGGALSLTVAAPYFGGPQAILDLAERLSVGALDIHVPQALPVAGELFNFGATAAEPTALDVLCPAVGKPARPEHAKIIEIVCRDGRLFVSGSANGSRPALNARRNVELVVLRIERGATRRLGRRPRTGPMPDIPPPATPSVEGAGGGLIHASLLQGVIRGTVFHRNANDSWNAMLEIGDHRYDLGRVEVASGRFTLAAPADDLLVSSGRAILTFEREEGRARGFLIFTDLLSLSRRLGPSAGPLLRFAAGGGDDDDLGAILEWFAMNPDETLSPWRTKSAGQNKQERAPILVPISELTALGSSSDAAHTAEERQLGGGSESALDRLLARLRVSLQTAQLDIANQGADQTDAEDLDDGGTIRPPAEGAGRVLEAFDELWEVLAARISAEPGAELLRMAELGAHVLLRRQASAERTRRFVEDWATLAVKHLRPGEPDREVTGMAIAFVVAVIVLGGDPARGRRRLLHLLGPAHLSDAPRLVRSEQTSAVQQLLRPLSSPENQTQAWAQMLASRGPYDDLLELVQALKTSAPLPAAPALASHPGFAEIRRLDARGRRDLIMIVDGPVSRCPTHSQMLPKAEELELKLTGLARPDCCGRVLVNLEP